MRPFPHQSAKPHRVVAAPLYSLIAQSVERRTVNPQVPGSSPGRGANIYKDFGDFSNRHPIYNFRFDLQLFCLVAFFIFPGDTAR